VVDDQNENEDEDDWGTEGNAGSVPLQEAMIDVPRNKYSCLAS
jgi:hypothetical protein